MLDLHPGAPKIVKRKGKIIPPPAPPKIKPASLRSSKNTLARKLNIRPDVAKEADKLEVVEKKKKEMEAMPPTRLPVPKAIQVVGQDATRDFYLERGGIKKAEVLAKPQLTKIDKDAQEYSELLANIDKPLDQSIPTKTTGSFIDQLKHFSN
jgi:hypothetical protein